MLAYHYERISFSSLSFIGEDLGRNRKGENYRQIIDRMAKDGFAFRGSIPVRYEDGKITDMDLIFEIDC